MKKKILATIFAILVPALLFAAAEYFPDIIVKGAPWYDVRGYADLPTALTAVGASEKTILVVSNVAVSADATIPATAHVWYLGGGKFTVASGKVLTHNASITAANHLIWVGPGTVVPPKAKLKLAWMGGLTQAVALLGSAQSHVVVENAYTQAANVTTPTTMSISFVSPGQVSVSTGYTWTCNGPLIGIPGCLQGVGTIVPPGSQASDASWWPSLAKVVADCGSSVRDISVSSALVVSGNLTIPATLSLHVLSTGQLQPAGGTTLTLNCALTAGEYQIFGGAGSIAFGTRYNDH